MAKRKINAIEKKMRPKQQSAETPLEFFAANCAMLVAVFFAFGFVFENFVIPSASMASTLLVGDHVLVDRLTPAPPASWAPFVPYRDIRRGDIVVFYKPTEEPDGQHLPLVKRVVGVPGDRLHLSGGIVYLNGVRQQEPHAAKPPYDEVNSYRDEFPSVPASEDPRVTAQWSLQLPANIQAGELVVPPGSYFVMGDNRANSADSRYWGFVPRANVLGRPLLVYWSFPAPDDLESRPTREQTAFALHEIVHFFDQTRWRRTLHRVE
jgi:signal peptidase I